MDPLFWFNTLMRSLHVASAVIGLGGAVAIRFAVLPALERLPNAAEAVEALQRPYKRLMHSAIGLQLVTGFYNYLVVALPNVRALRVAGQPLPGYDAVMGVKILLGLAFFAITLLLLKPVPSFQEKRNTWLSLSIAMGLVIVLLGAYLRRIWPLGP